MTAGYCVDLPIFITIQNLGHPPPYILAFHTYTPNRRIPLDFFCTNRKNFQEVEHDKTWLNFHHKFQSPRGWLPSARVRACARRKKRAKFWRACREERDKIETFRSMK